MRTTTIQAQKHVFEVTRFLNVAHAARKHFVEISEDACGRRFTVRGESVRTAYLLTITPRDRVCRNMK